MWITAFELDDTDFLVGLIEEEYYIPKYKVIDGKVLIYSEHKRDAEKEKAYYESYLINCEFDSWVYEEEDEYDDEITNPYYENGVKPSDFY